MNIVQFYATIYSALPQAQYFEFDGLVYIYDSRYTLGDIEESQKKTYIGFIDSAYQRVYLNSEYQYLSKVKQQLKHITTE